jgi:hypothetical protein
MYRDQKFTCISYNVRFLIHCKFWPNLFLKGCILAQPFFKRLYFDPTFFQKVVFWPNLFLKGCILAQPFFKRLFLKGCVYI